MKKILLTYLSLFLFSCSDKNLQLANDFYKQGNYKEALIKYEEVLKNNPDSEVAVIRIKECKIIVDRENRAQKVNKFINDENFDDTETFLKNLLIEQPSNLDFQNKLKLVNNMSLLISSMKIFQIEIETYSIDNKGSYPVNIDYDIYKNKYDELSRAFSKERVGISLEIPLVITKVQYDNYIKTNIFPGKDSAILPNSPDRKINKSDLKGVIVYEFINIAGVPNYRIYGVNEKGDLTKTVFKSY